MSDRDGLPAERAAAAGDEVRPQAARGQIYSYTVMQEAPAEFVEQAPYVLALIQLDDGGRVTAQLTDLDGPVQIGDRVEMVTRKLTTDGSRGIIVYGYKFRPLFAE